MIPREFSAVLVKGPAQLSQLAAARSGLARSQSLFNDDEQLEQLREIRKWSKSTADGSLSDLTFQPLGQVWDEVASDSGNCLGRRCPTYNQCFYYKDRRRRRTHRFWSSITRCCSATSRCGARASASCPITTS